MPTLSVLTNRDRKFLSSSMFSMYLYGKCYEFAIALHEGLSLPLVGIEVGEDIIHVGVKSGDDLYRDVRGDLPLDNFKLGFFVPEDAVIRQVTIEELQTLYKKHNKVELGQHLIDSARIHAETIWPLWVWKDSRLERMEIFAQEFEELCRKHGIWIREQFPANPSIVYFGDETEVGYTFTQFTTAHMQFLLARKLE